MNPLTCGVAKFNALLAGRLGVPVLHVLEPAAVDLSVPLLSLKLAEFTVADVAALERVLETAKWRHAFRLFLHAWSDTPVERRLLDRAEAAFCGNAELAAMLAPLRRDLVELWAPPLLVDPAPFERTELSVFSFGMAHKIRGDHYQRLRRLLEATGRSYCLYLSTALHETTSFDDSFRIVFDELREMFGPRVHFLGYLSDTAVYNWLVDTTYFAAFFERGVRANNTSVNAAMQAGAVVITNLDPHSPRGFVHGANLLDIGRCQALPTDAQTLGAIGARARATVEQDHGWGGLLAVLRGF
jgi:hypothetical protein